MGAAITPWIRLRLPSCRHGFESQAHHQCFYQFIVSCRKDDNKQKEARIGPFFKKEDKNTLFLEMAVRHESIHLLTLMSSLMLV